MLGNQLGFEGVARDVEGTGGSRRRLLGTGADARVNRAMSAVFVTAILLLSTIGALSVVGSNPGQLTGSLAPVSAAPSAPSPTGSAVAVPIDGSGSPMLDTTTNSVVTPRVVGLDLPGPHPASWGTDDLPPGMPAALPASADPSGPCDEVAPALGGQSLLGAGCVGHDEPSLSLYSNVPGSGGNVSWNATLPEDGSSVENQSDLYAAAWFGIVVSDPDAWLGQCYVEIQLYPDFSWAAPDTSTSGVWSGAAVGWQVDPVSGAIDTCYYSPLYLHGVSADGSFTMTQGDSFQLRLLGWEGSPVGEEVWLNDTTSGAETSVALYNSTAGIALDPAYAANDVENALLWTAGGQLPISFAFEIGREGNPSGVTDSAFDGCTPGTAGGGPTVNPSTPCPSYDPLSWVNDTLTPWTIGVPTFPSGTSSATPAQFGAASTVGGTGAIPVLSNGTCGSRIGAAFCTYPWFSYSCSAPGFTFGAADFASVTDDFGESSEFPTVPVTSVLGTSVFPMGNFTVPACGAATHTVTLTSAGSATGTVSFLSGTYTGTSTISGIPNGNYSILALPAAGAGFAGWTVLGNVAVASALSPSTTVSVSGDGTLTAVFTTPPVQSEVTFNTTPSGGSVLVTPGALYSDVTAPTTVASGTSLGLAPGVYGIQGANVAGTEFLGWSIPTGASDVSLASIGSDVTWLTVTGATPQATVNANFATTTGDAAVNVTINGTGTVKLGATTVHSSSLGLVSQMVSVLAGTYPVVASPGAGWRFDDWTYAPAATMVEFNSTALITFPAGVAAITATFAANVTSASSPGMAGRVAINDVGPLSNDTASWLPRGTYALDALPFGGETFSHWTVSNGASLVVASSTSSVTHVTVNSNGTLTAVYVVAPAVNATFVNDPSNGGEIRFNYQYLTGASTLNSTLATGTFVVRAIPAAGWVFHNWTITDPPLGLSFGTGTISNNLVVSGGGGTLTANFEHAAYAVSFVDEENSIFLNATIGSHTVKSGQTIYLTPGKYALVAVPGTNTTFLKWETTGAMSIGSATKSHTNLTVSGAGTVSVIGDGFLLTGISASPAATDVGIPATFTAIYAGAAPHSFAWSGLPTGCTSADADAVDCTPSAAGTFSVVVSVAGANGIAVKSGALAFVVGGTLAVSSLTASRLALDLGMTTDLSATLTGGTGPFSYVYSGLPAGCASANSSTLACTPTATGSFSPEVSVTDARGERATNSVDLSVDPALDVLGLNTSRITVTATVPFVLTTDATGGVPALSYTYSGLPTGCASSNSSTLTCTPAATGNYTIEVTVTDAAGESGLASVTVNVNPLPTISSFTVTPDQLVLGANVTFAVVAAGGTGPLGYVFNALPTGCTSANVTSFSCRPVLVGTFAVSVTVTDVYGKTVTADAQLTITATSTSPAPGSSGTSTAWWVWVVIAAVVVLAVVVGIVAWVRARPPKPSPPKAWDENEPSAKS